MANGKVWYANVLLLDNKIMLWKTGSSKYESKEGWRMRFCDFDLPFTCESKKFVESETVSNYDIFQKLSKDFYRQWEIHEDFYAPNRPYGEGSELGFKPSDIIEVKGIEIKPADLGVENKEVKCTCVRCGSEFHEMDTYTAEVQYRYHTDDREVYNRSGDVQLCDGCSEDFLFFLTNWKEKTCSVCNGEGTTLVTIRESNISDSISYPKRVKCPACKGKQ